MVTFINDPHTFKLKALRWAASFDVCCYLDSNNFSDPYSKFDTLLAVGVGAEIQSGIGDAFYRLEQFRMEHPGWITGFLSYDLKNETEDLLSANKDGLGFPDMYFFAPVYVITIYGNEIDIEGPDPEFTLRAIEQQELTASVSPTEINIKQRFTRQAYIDRVNAIKGHISRGDIYVTNFCQEFFAENAVIDPLAVFLRLNELSPNPFACFFKLYNKYVLCASPERFMAKRGHKLISQPIKGTAKRGADDAEDAMIKAALRNHTKELQENVMIVDLVRNDLTRSAKPGTVKAEELFGIHSFNQVHQMVSTITCELRDDVSPLQAIKSAFPMGSMTGAPKVRAMQLMEHYEQTRRGLYSGAIGYFGPDGDLDLNVVIRTILYNADDHYLSFQAGSAITYHADAEKEYEECLLKVKAIMEVLGS